MEERRVRGRLRGRRAACRDGRAEVRWRAVVGGSVAWGGRRAPACACGRLPRRGDGGARRRSEGDSRGRAGCRGRGGRGGRRAPASSGQRASGWRRERVQGGGRRRQAVSWAAVGDDRRAVADGGAREWRAAASGKRRAMACVRWATVAESWAELGTWLDLAENGQVPGSRSGDVDQVCRVPRGRHMANNEP